jgi:hypothetical protein
MNEAENTNWDLENMENMENMEKLRNASRFLVMTFAYRSIFGLFYDQTADLTELPL